MQLILLANEGKGVAFSVLFSEWPTKEYCVHVLMVQWMRDQLMRGSIFWDSGSYSE